METAGTSNNLGLLREGIARGAALVLSLPTSGRLRHHKSRFLADAGDGIWVASVSDEPGLLEEIIAGGQPAGVSFRSGEFKVIFATQILHRKTDYEWTAGVDETGESHVEALLLQFPTEIRTVQRRKSFRVPVVPGSTDLRIRLWLITEQASLRDRPSATKEIECEPRDVSLGGVGVTIHASAGKTPAIATGDRIRVELTMRGTLALLEGRLRYPPRPIKNGTSFRAGVQFRTLDESRDDRNAAIQLNKIVNELQRDLIRRKKLGLAVPTA